MTAGSGGDGEPLVGTPAELLHRAARHFNDGDYATAERICHGIVASQPKNAEAFHILGHVAMRTQRGEQAIDHFLRAVTLAPGEARFRRSLAETLEQTGRPDQAIQAWDQFALLAPQDHDALNRLATLQLLQGQVRDAVESFRRSLALAPGEAAAHYRLGIALHRAGEAEDAVAQLESALALGEKPWPEAHSALSAALRDSGRLADAVAHARQAVAMKPELAAAQNNLALALLDAGDEAGAAAALQTAMQLRPDDPEILNNAGVVLAQTGALTQAEAILRRVLQQRPGGADGHLNLANVLRQAQRFDEAMEQYQAALAAAPEDFRIHGSLALAQLNMDRPQDAIASYKRALALAPGNPELVKGLGIAQLTLGDYAAGWANYAFRLRGRDAPQRDFDCPEWDGADLGGGTLLIHAEQGFGDTLQFCRYVPLLADRAGSVVFECQPALLSLMASLGNAPRLVARSEPPPAADAHVALLSLPQRFGTTLATIPHAVPYLHAAPDGLAEWRERLDTGRRPTIGLVWSGNPRRQDDRMRSCPLAALEPLLRRDDIGLVSLQMEAGEEDLAQLRDYGIPDLSGFIRSFSDTAAAIAALDLVVSVDTATAHLAGALGRPVWVLLGRGADWRYLLDRDDSPWYPSMRLFRQARHGDWAELARRVERRLSDFFA